MGQKIKIIIIIVLGALLLLSIFGIFQTQASKITIEKQRDGLKKENENLVKKLDELTQEGKQLQDKLKALSADLDKASQEKQDAQKQYEAIAKERESLIDKVKSLQKTNEQLRGDLNNMARERQRLGQSIESNIAPLKNENTQLKEQLNNLNAAKGRLETELASLKEEKSDFERKFAEIDSVLRQNLTRYRYAIVRQQLDAMDTTGAGAKQAQAAQPEKESVELAPIVVSSQAKAAPEPPAMLSKDTYTKPTGVVLQVNRENKFVIIDLGEKSGIRLGNMFKVYRQGEPIADIEVIQIRQSISACDIRQETTPIQTGDVVR